MRILVILNINVIFKNAKCARLFENTKCARFFENSKIPNVQDFLKIRKYQMHKTPVNSKMPNKQDSSKFKNAK